MRSVNWTLIGLGIFGLLQSTLLMCPHCHPPTDRQKGPMKHPKKTKQPRKPTQ